MRAKKLRTKVVGLVAAVMVVGAPLTAWAIDVAGGDLYYNGGQTDTIVYSEIGRKAGISRNYMVKATVKVGGDTYTSGFKSNYAYKDAKRVWWANETSYYVLSILSKIVQTPRAGLFVPPYFIHFFKERGVCYEKIFKDFYFP